MKRWAISLVAALMLTPTALGADQAAMRITSDPSDPVGQGVTIDAATPQDPVVLTFWGNGQENGEFLYGQGVTVQKTTSDGYSAVTVGLGAGQRLEVGTYVATLGSLYPWDPTTPVLDATVQGRSCESVRGVFTVTRADYSPTSNLYALAATFAIAECNGEPSSLAGSINLTRDTIETMIDPSVRIRAGTATVTGKLFCSLPHVVETGVSISQPVDPLQAYAQKYTGPLTCVPGGQVPWSVTMASSEGKALKPGEARISTFSFTDEPWPLDIRELIVRMTGR